MWLMDRDELINKALKQMDPEDTLLENIGDRDRIREMIGGWIDQYGNDSALRMAQRSNRYLKAWNHLRSS